MDIWFILFYFVLLNIKDMTKEYIQEQLQFNPKWIERGLVVLYNRQTQDEKENVMTKWENGVGFNGSDVKYLTYCSKWVLSGRSLSGVHLNKCGKMLKKYWKQIQQEIEKKSRN